jgi:hypothetical protein
MNKIQSLWVGALSPVEELTIRSFLKHGHEFHLYSYGEIDGLPGGCIAHYAGEILPESEIARFQCLANFSDLFRYALLYRMGGWWVDMDVCCLKPFDFKADHVFSSQYERNGNADEANSGIIRAPKGSPVIKYCIDRIAGIDTKKSGWAECGPMSILLALKKFGMKPEPSVRFCPLHYFEAPGNVFGAGSDAVQFSPETYAIHLWNEEARRAGIDKFADYPGSLFDRLRRAN